MKNIRFSNWTVPLALLAAGLASFGLLLPRLGFYWDDWSPVLVNRVYGTAAFWRFYAFDRPSSAWSYVLFAPLLGGNPLAWHALTFLLRWLTAVAMWWTFSSVWPAARRAVAAAALLFLVYPVFTQQYIAVTYHQFWLEFGLYFLSMGAMVQAARSVGRPVRFWLFTLLGLAAFGLNFSISEYFIGVELLRPVLLWMVLSGSVEVVGNASLRKRLAQTLRLWLPYLLVLGFFVYWRLFLMKTTGGDPNKPLFLFELFSKPGQALMGLAQIAARDIVQILASAWYGALNPALFDLERSFTLLSWVLVLGVAVLSAFYLYRFNPQGEPEAGRAAEKGASQWARQAALVGLLAVLLGPGPAWITGRFMVAGAGQLPPDPFSDRYGASAMFGAALLVVAFLEWLTPRRAQKALMIGALIGLAAGLHLRTANDFRWLWTQQTRFFWQLSWRAPSIQPDTIIFAKDDIFPIQGRFATSVALNLAYPQSPAPEYLNLWVFSLNPGGNPRPAGELIQGQKFDQDFRIFKFLGNSRDSLVIRYEPQDGTCLWVLGPNDSYAPGLADVVRKTLPAGNLARIGPKTDPNFPPKDIFGAEPAHTWCYYYEKAALAQQMKDWPAVVNLAGQALEKGYRPGRSGSDTAFEWLPFVEGYAQAGQWEQARSLALEISKTKRISTVDPMLCQFWDGVKKSTAPSTVKDTTVSEVEKSLGCGKQAQK